MAETTNPGAGVDVSQDDLAKMTAVMARHEAANSAPTLEQPAALPAAEAPARAPAQAEAPPPESQADALTPEDLPEETPASDATQPEAIDFDIVHNGQTHKVATRAEAIELMSKGFDYTQKTQVLAEASRAAQAALQRSQEIEQVQQAVANDLGVVSSLQQQLQQYQGINWMALAQDPQQYATVQAQYNALQQEYGRAAQQLTQKVDAIKQAKTQMTAQALQHEAARLPDFIPEWRDPQKYESGRNELARYLADGVTKAGGDTSQIGRYLDSAFAVMIAHKAMTLDRLTADKANKVKQLRTAPPVTRPGAAQDAGTANADREGQLMARLKKSGDPLDAAALLAARWNRR